MAHENQAIYHLIASSVITRAIFHQHHQHTIEQINIVLIDGVAIGLEMGDSIGKSLNNNTPCACAHYDDDDDQRNSFTIFIKDS